MPAAVQSRLAAALLGAWGFYQPVAGLFFIFFAPNLPARRPASFRDVPGCSSPRRARARSVASMGPGSWGTPLAAPRPSISACRGGLSNCPSASAAASTRFMAAKLLIRWKLRILSAVLPRLHSPPKKRAAAGGQNHVLIPKTKLVACTRSPAARAKRAVSPTFRSQDTPM